MLVVGDGEAEAGTVAVRRHGEGDLGALPVAEFAGQRAMKLGAGSRYTRRQWDTRHAHGSRDASVPSPAAIA